MKITIDTKEDTHDEIKNVIKMLSSLVGHSIVGNQGNLFGDDADKPESPDMFNMFNNPDSVNKSEEPNEEESEDIDLGIPKVEEY
jgi:hypothetical protein